MDLDRYVEFMQQEANLAGQERIRAKDIEQVNTFYKMIVDKKGYDDSFAYMNKHLDVLLNYAPHLTLQLYLSLCSSNIESQVGIVSYLQSLLNRQDIPAKSYSVINSYLSIFKEKETTPPSSNMASDEKILQALDTLTPQKVQSVVVMISLRLQLGENLDYFINLMNPFMLSNKDPMLKLQLVIALSQICNKYPANIPLKLKMNEDTYNIVLDGSLDLNTDTFIKLETYYVNQLQVPSGPKELVLSTASMFRILNYNKKEVLNTEADIKSFALAILEMFNMNAMLFQPNLVFSIKIPDEYRNKQGYIEGKKLVTQVYKSNF